MTRAERKIADARAFAERIKEHREFYARHCGVIIDDKTLAEHVLNMARCDNKGVRERVARQYQRWTEMRHPPDCAADRPSATT
jgi:hypothetical protein